MFLEMFHTCVLSGSAKVLRNGSAKRDDFFSRFVAVFLIFGMSYDTVQKSPRAIPLNAWARREKPNGGHEKLI